MQNEFDILRETSTERQIRESVRKIIDSLGAGYIDRCLETDTPPQELWDELSRGGYLGIGISTECGGGGLGLYGLSCVAEELAYKESLLVMLVMSSGIVAPILEKWGTDYQKDKYLRRMATGEIKFSFAITEQDAGSSLYNIKTALKRGTKGNYSLNGSKCFISGVNDADYILVVARVKQDDGTVTKPVLCIVDAKDTKIQKTVIDMPNFSADKQWQLFFDNVDINENHIVGGLDNGLAAVFCGLNPERILMAAYCNGISINAIERASKYARERKVWEKPIGTHQGISHPLAKAKIDLEQARLMTRKAALLHGSIPENEVAEYANYAKYASAEAAIHAVDTAIQVHGGNGFTDTYGIAKLYWPARLFRTAPVSAEMILNYVSQNILNLPRSY